MRVLVSLYRQRQESSLAVLDLKHDWQVWYYQLIWACLPVCT
jgi:hypothetical protein